MPNIAYQMLILLEKKSMKPRYQKLQTNYQEIEQRHDDVDGDKNNALLVEVPAPATPRMGNKQYNDVVMSAAHSPYKA